MPFIKRNFFFLIFVVGTVFQILCAIFGFDMSDEGFLMTLFRDFGNGVDAAKTGSGYPISCYMGWCLSQLTPDSILAIRLWGVLFISINVIILYHYLKDKFNHYLLSIGLLVIMLFLGNDPKPFGYNNITGIIATLSLIVIVEGSIKKKWYLLITGGLLIGLNTFVRLPNVLEFSFVFIPFVADFTTWKEIMKKNTICNTIIVVLGCFIGGVCSWMFLAHIGICDNVIEFLSTIAGQLDGDSSHSSSSMLLKFGRNYLLALVYTCGYLITMILISLLYNSKKYIGSLFVAVVLFFLYRQIYLDCNALGNTILSAINGIGMLGGIIYWIWGNKMQRTLGVSAVLMSFVLPLGSDQGFVTMWTGSWLSLPIGLCATEILMEKIRWYFDSKVILSLSNASKNKTFRLNFSGARYGAYLCSLVLVLVTGVKVYHDCYYDPGDRFQKVCSIESKFAKGIYTCKDKADRINPLLAEMRNYVHASDTILAYDWAPMLFFLTDTKPYANISWPCIYYGIRYVDEINKAEIKHKGLPIVILQNFRAVDDLRGDMYCPENAKDKSEMLMTRCILEFTEKYKYRKVWSNGWYEILLPPNRYKLQAASNDW